MKGEFYRMEYEAWDEGTDEMSLELEAAYLRACHQMYRRRAAIPETLATFARIWRCHPNKARKLLDGLIEAGKLVRTPEGLTNTRVRQEIDHRETTSRQRGVYGELGGRRSGEVRRNALKDRRTDEAFASTQTKQNEAEETRGEEITPIAPRGGRTKRGERIDPNWKPAEAEVTFALSLGIPRAEILNIAAEYVDYWKGVAGAKGCKLDWPATFRNRCRDVAARKGYKPPVSRAIGSWQLPADEPTARAAWMRNTWPDFFGPAPGLPGCKVPESIQAEWITERDTRRQVA